MIALTSKDPAKLPVDALVVATAPKDGGVELVGTDWLPGELRSALVRDAGALGVTGKADEVRRVPATGLKAKVLVLVGLGTGPVTAERLRRAAGAATRELAGVGSVALALPAGDVAATVAVAEGALLGAYTYTRYRAADAARAPVASIEVVTTKAKDAAATQGVARAEVLAAAQLGVPASVTGWLCLAENMPSGTAQRPSDVVTIRGGKTVEVLNTDAEGRLVMADGLVAAIRLVHVV
ncbi:MAG: hypothetical protein J0I40_15275, partial [Cellulomonas sp.]|nr:hypothetical protein [Cellulomonas sp.]